MRNPHKCLNLRKPGQALSLADLSLVRVAGFLAQEPLLPRFEWCAYGTVFNIRYHLGDSDAQGGA